jgi:hypothetical protein
MGRHDHLLEIEAHDGLVFGVHKLTGQSLVTKH